MRSMEGVRTGEAGGMHVGGMDVGVVSKLQQPRHGAAQVSHPMSGEKRRGTETQ